MKTEARVSIVSTKNFSDLEKTLVAGFEACSCFLSILTEQNQKGRPLNDDEYWEAWRNGSKAVFDNYLTYTSPSPDRSDGK